ncbi:nuclear transport factor 2 family protein [Photobacterium rosenbergii]|uniref:Nuclear transport factor 2 family protein n=1 Tax=Photobacterium rosenbergii TaxID=294936 RepID=A0A2T3NLD5_9GAMM|nr:nuclear transport factor 2 family protein [Photobacterium rosenbergii]PSW16262.1 nuclear transport factor 2 family protein [Photobacterium rosenbergii]
MKLKYFIPVLFGVLSMAVNAAQLIKDEAQIRSNINSFSALTDQGAFEYLGRLFAPQLTVDYTSLFGGEPQSVSRQELMAQWAAFLPGFDVTFHDLQNMKVAVNQEEAKATVDFTASHWLGKEGFWAISGEYEFSLTKAGSNWQITSVKLNAKGEEGSRDVLEEAPKHAKDNLEARESLKVSYQ